MQTLSDIITSIHGSSDSEKGRLFELLCLYFLRHDKLHKSLYSDARLWKDSPIANGQPDTGIDIVAKLRDSDSYCAVQCKFRDDDSSITKAELDSFLAASSKAIYSRRILFTLTGNFGRNARDTLSGQVPPVTCLTLRDLDRSTLDWSAYPENVSYTVKTLLPHQTQAVDAVIEGFSHSDRGKLIMACGTGKTLTSQRIAERYAGKGGLVLVLVPSISLLNQSLLAWNYDSDEAIPLRSFAVCSDATVGRKDYPDEDMKLSDLVIPPTTDAINLVREFTPDSEAMTVIFSTYQSLQVISDAQKNGLPEFDIVICDEAHRTAGTASADSYFRLVHDNGFIHSRKRLYMTATPKIFTENLKAKAQDDNILLCSMDNAEIYGPEFFRLSFSQAVEQNLLTDYKVMVFMVEKDNPDEPDMPAIVQGVSRALAKDISEIDADFLENDTSPMHRAVAFANTIAASKDFTSLAAHQPSIDTRHIDGKDSSAKRSSSLQWLKDESPACRILSNEGVDASAPDASKDFTSLAAHQPSIDTRHIDGKDSSAKRSSSLQWLKDESPSCRILSNARCLCEGVDVPALDAVIFISPKSSEIDIVQSVGRVMRKAQGKKYGYVILPVIVRLGETPEQALDNNDSYRTVWKVLQALRAHDDHFNAVINSLDFGGSSGKIRVTGSRHHHEWLNDDLAEKYRQQIYIRMVRKCGDREYWSSWVADLVNAFQAISARITSAIPNVRDDFDSFTEELRAAINPSISPEQAVEMLAQHITSKEVFDAIFTGFADYNPVSQSMQKMRAILEANGADLDPKGLEKFNEHVRDKARSATTGEAKQKLLRNIYENFFAQAFPSTAKTLGIVYTPEQIVDFIIRSADWAARDLLKIDGGLSAEGVHILDPFSGTGTFTARLIQLGIIPPEKLYAKYTGEIHANEILLLAYYISAVNIEAAYNQMAGGFYTEFPGMVLADTFRLNEGGTPYLHKIFRTNGERADEQEKDYITVIIGNPPYSVGGKNSIYTAVDGRITETYAKKSTATNKNSLYDSYIRAIRWASDRIDGRGIICFVSNGSFIDSNSADGMRKCLAEEFTGIYIFNLRGNANTSGDIRRKEAGNVFGDGTRCPIAVTLLVKAGKSGTKSRCVIRYHESGDGLKREEKLEELVSAGSFGEMMRSGELREIEANAAGDWVNQRSGDYEGFVSLGNKKEERAALFEERYSAGLKTARDAWCYNFSREALCGNMKTLLQRVNARDERVDWNRGLLQAAQRGTLTYSDDSVRVGLYRPYVKEMLYFSRETNDRVYQMPQIFPSPDTKNLVICVSGVAGKNYSVLMTDCLPGFDTLGKTQCFPLFWHEEVKSSLFGSYTARRDGISGAMLEEFRRHYDDEGLTHEDVFCYVYGVLSSREYALRFGNDTRRVLARVPMVKGRERFRRFCEAGRELGRLHVNYESAEIYPVRLEGSTENLTITKMRIIERGVEKVIRYNDGLTVSGIPGEAWEYVVNGRSALGWIVERYRDEVDVKSGLRNDCNAWGRERGNKGYVLELIGRVVSVSVRTMEILRELPELGV